MDWFEKLTGLRDEETRAKLAVDGDRLRSLVNGKSSGNGQLEFVSLAELRSRLKSDKALSAPTKVCIEIGDIRKLHHEAANERAVLQVASQFNLLEMVLPNVTPAHGVTRYQYDRTQGPACATACGAATIYHAAA